MNQNERNPHGEKGKKLKEFICSPIGKAGLIIILYVIVFGLVLCLVNFFDGIIGLVPALVFCYFGWKALNRITPDIFLIMPVIGWLFYFIVKLILAVAIGMFVTPFVIAKNITAAIQNSVR